MHEQLAVQVLRVERVFYCTFSAHHMTEIPFMQRPTATTAIALPSQISSSISSAASSPAISRSFL